MGSLPPAYILKENRIWEATILDLVWYLANPKCLRPFLEGQNEVVLHG